ncbi:MAG: hypothetical protein IPP74_03515 [Alphaproteobacteria bacterium]|nr:hypothetical protein [Alphaproteobacteria bacterium]
MTKDTDKFSHKNPSKRKNGGEERDYSFFAIREQQQARRNAFTQARRHFNESELERARTLDKKSVLRPAIKSVESGCSPQTIELPLDKILKSRHAPIRDDFYNIQKRESTGRQVKMLIMFPSPIGTPRIKNLQII